MVEEKRDHIEIIKPTSKQVAKLVQPWKELRNWAPTNGKSINI